jgi:hypothetical protein
VLSDFPTATKLHGQRVIGLEAGSGHPLLPLGVNKRRHRRLRTCVGVGVGVEADVLNS